MEPQFLHVDGIISSYSFVVSIHEYYICTFKNLYNWVNRMYLY